MGILDGKVAIVTGGARGLGRAAVVAMAVQGAAVLIADSGVDRDGSRPDPRLAHQAANDLQQLGYRVAACHADVATADGARQMAAECLASFGRIDVLHANAGTLSAGRFIDIADADWDAVIGSHVGGLVHSLRAVLPTMIAQGSGTIITVSSPGALWGAPGLSHYAAAKGAVWGLGNALWKELDPLGIRLVTLVPNGDTGRQDPGQRAFLATMSADWPMVGIVPAGEPDPAKAGVIAAWLASDEAGDIAGRTIFCGADRLAWYPEVDQPKRAIVARGDSGWTIEALQRQFHHAIPAGPPQFYAGDPPLAPTPAGAGMGGPTRGRFAATLHADRLLEGKVAIITGAGRGIGRAAALEFARLGARVVVNDYGIGMDSHVPDSGHAAAVADAIRQAGGHAVAHHGDVRDPADARSMVDTAHAAFGPVDILYNNAGFTSYLPFLEVDAATWDLVFDVSLGGTRQCSLAALPDMLERGNGVIINTSSPGALWGAPRTAPYAAAKGGIWGLTRALYKEVYSAGVRVHCVVPGADTRRGVFPDATAAGAAAAAWLRLGSVRAGQPRPERVAPITAYLASDECRDLTGRTIYAAGDTVALFDEPRLVNTMTAPGGWTIADLRRAWRAIVPPQPASPRLIEHAPSISR